MANGDLDRVGCEFGRITRQQLEDLKRHCAARVAQTDERLRTGSEKFEDLERDMRELDTRVSVLERRMAWFLGLSAAVGALLGTVIPQILEKLLRHI